MQCLRDVRATYRTKLLQAVHCRHLSRCIAMNCVAFRRAFLQSTSKSRIRYYIYIYTYLWTCSISFHGRSLEIWPHTDEFGDCVCLELSDSVSTTTVRAKWPPRPHAVQGSHLRSFLVVRPGNVLRGRGIYRRSIGYDLNSIIIQ